MANQSPEKKVASRYLPTLHQELPTMIQDETNLQSKKDMDGYAHTKSVACSHSGVTQQFRPASHASTTTISTDATQTRRPGENYARNYKECPIRATKRIDYVTSGVKNSRKRKEASQFQSPAEVENKAHHAKSSLELELMFNFGHGELADDPVLWKAFSRGAAVFTSGVMHAVITKLLTSAHSSAGSTANVPENSYIDEHGVITSELKPVGKITGVDMKQAIHWDEQLESTLSQNPMSAVSGQLPELVSSLSPTSGSEVLSEQQDRRPRQGDPDCTQCRHVQRCHQPRQPLRKHLSHSQSRQHQRQQPQRQHMGKVQEHQFRDHMHDVTKQQTSQPLETQQTFPGFKPPLPSSDRNSPLHLEKGRDVSIAESATSSANHDKIMLEQSHHVPSARLESNSTSPSTSMDLRCRSSRDRKSRSNRIPGAHHRMSRFSPSPPVKNELRSKKANDSNNYKEPAAAYGLHDVRMLTKMALLIGFWWLCAVWL